MSGIAVAVSIDGGEALRTADAATAVQHAARQLGQALAEAALARAAARAPRDTGALAGSGRVEPAADGATVDFQADYAPFVHGPMDGSGGRTAPHWPPFGPDTPLAAWAGRHDIPPFLVARAISRKGTPMIPFLTDAVAETLSDEFEQEAEAALADLAAALGFR